MLPVFINKDTPACATLTAGSQYHPCGRSPFGSITRHVGDMWLLLDVKLPLEGPSSCYLTTAGLLQSVQLKGVYLQALLGIHARFWQCSQRKFCKKVHRL